MSVLEIKQGDIYTIAEMSANHGGSLERALEIVWSAKTSGADCLKIQTYTPDSLTIDCDNRFFRINGGLWNGRTLYDLYSEAATPYEWQGRIKAECDRAGIDFLSTPFDEAGADFLEKLGVGAYKIASFELVHIPLIRHIAKKGKPIILSCGMASAEEIQESIDAMLDEGLSLERIILLKCASEYPAGLESMNLLTIPDMIRRFKTRVGLSDHSIGTAAPVTAAALGATVIEKHFCLSRDIKTPDSQFSTEPKEFVEMVEAVKAARSARGEVFYGTSDSEIPSKVFRRSLFAVKDIAPGEIFTEDNIKVIRPGYGLPPKFLSALRGKQSKNRYRAGEPVAEDEIR